MVRIKLYGKKVASVGQELLVQDFKGQRSLEEVIQMISQENPLSFSEIGAILINGKNCILAEGLKTVINDGDLVEILSLVRGG
jgi:molybdopterin converting factor small subunit